MNTTEEDERLLEKLMQVMVQNDERKKNIFNYGNKC